MTRLAAYRREWFSNIRGDILSGIVVALALIPEAIGFSVIAGVDPKVGLYAILRVYGLVFGAEAGELAGLGRELLGWLALLTVAYFLSGRHRALAAAPVR